MKNAPASLVTFMQQAEVFILANLYTWTLIDGTVLLRTDAQQDVIITPPGAVSLRFLADDMLVQGIKYQSGVGLDADEQQLKLGYWPASSSKATVVTPISTGVAVPIAKALQQGLFDGATLRWDRVVLAEWGGTPIGTGDMNPDGTVSDGRVLMNSARVADLKIGRVETQMTVKSPLSLLDINLPRNIWKQKCKHVFCDAGCTLIKANFATSGSVGTGATNLVIPWSGSAAAIYEQGTILFGSGENAGVEATIKSCDAASLTLGYQLDYVPAEGDLFTAYQGCVRTHARCKQLNNTANLRLYPWVPAPETAA